MLRVLKDAKMIFFVKHFPYLQFPDAFVLVLVERPRAAAEDWAWNTTIVTNDVIFCNFVAKSPFYLLNSRMHSCFLGKIEAKMPRKTLLASIRMFSCIPGHMLKKLMKMEAP